MRWSGRSILITAFVLLFASITYVAWRGVTITVHVAAPSDVEHDLLHTMRAVGREFAGQSNWLKVIAKPVPTMDDARQAIADHAVDLAILRSDQAMPASTAVVAILRKDVIFLVAPGGSKLDSFSDLKNSNLGVLAGPRQNGDVLDSVLRFYGADPASVGRTMLQPSDVVSAFKEKRVVAIFVMGAPGRGAAADVFSAAARGGRSPPSVIGVAETDAIVAAVHYLGGDTIPKGAFRGEAPTEDTSAPSVDYRLVARSEVSDIVAGELARILMATKARLVNEPGVKGIAAPDTEQVSYPIHPGARAYYDGDPPSLLDSFETYFWLGWAVIGVLGSLATWLIGRTQGARDAELRDYRHLVLLLGEVRRADDKVLARLRDDFEETMERLLTSSQSGNLRLEEIQRYQLALSLVRDALASREGRVAPVTTGPRLRASES